MIKWKSNKVYHRKHGITLERELDTSFPSHSFKSTDVFRTSRRLLNVLAASMRAQLKLKISGLIIK